MYSVFQNSVQSRLSGHQAVDLYIQDAYDFPAANIGSAYGTVKLLSHMHCFSHDCIG